MPAYRGKPDNPPQYVRNIRPGRLMLYEFTPVYPDSMRYSNGGSSTHFTPPVMLSSGELPSKEAVKLGMINSLDAILGRENIIIKRDSEGKEVKREAGTPNKKVIYGVVTACGFECERNSVNLLPENHRDKDFPLPPGTLVKVTNSVDHVTAPQEASFSTWDTLEHKLVGQYHKTKVWGLLTEELQELVKKAQGEAVADE